MLGNENNMRPRKPDVMQGYINNTSMLNKPPATDVIVGQEEMFTKQTTETMLGVLLPTLGNK